MKHELQMRDECEITGFVCEYCNNWFELQDCCAGDEGGRPVDACPVCANFHCDSYIQSPRQVREKIARDEQLLKGVKR